MSARTGTARRVGGALAAALVLAFLVWGVAGGWSEAADYDWQLDWLQLAAALAVLALFYLAWVAGYVALVEILAGRRLERRTFASIWARSLLGRYVPGNVLMVAGRVVLGREAGVPARVSLAASVYEQVAMLAVAAVAAAAFLVFEGRDWSPLFWAVLALPLGLVLLEPAVFERVSRALLRRLGRSADLVLLSRGQVAVLLAWFALTMALLGVGTALAVRAVSGGDAGGVVFLSLGFLLAWAASMVAFVFPSGLGLREGAFAVILARHIPGPAAVSLAAASRLFITGVELALVACLAAVGLRASRRRAGRPARRPFPRRTERSSARRARSGESP